MDESYVISVEAPITILRSNEVWGALRAIESLSQLIYPDDERVRMLIKRGRIEDSPKYPYRGFMIDTSRHYIPMQIIMKQLDAMETVKLNVLHWHISDDQSFPFASVVYPNLTRFGAYNHQTHIYTARDMNEIIEEARLRGIRVIPELDVPAHTRSWGYGHPELFNECSKKNWKEGLGPLLDFEKNHTMEFVENLIRELAGIFKDPNFFLGGDEFSLKCVKGSRSSIEAFLDQLTKIVQRLRPNGRRTMFWQDVLNEGGEVPSNSIINVWKSWKSDEPAIKRAIQSRNISLIISHPWYLDHMKEGEKWLENYDAQMYKFFTDRNAISRILGGEACLWAEFVDATNFLQWAWPDAGTTAELLWTNIINTSSYGYTKERMNELRCRLIGRGIPARPIQPGFCDIEWSY